jgi:hypothetical protein
MVRAIDAGTRIPTRTLIEVLEMHFEQVVACLHRARDVDAEGVIAVSPFTHEFSIQKNLWFSHGSIKQEFGMGATLRNRDDALVKTLSNPG